MTDIAKLGFAISTEGLKDGQKELIDTAVAARKLEASEASLAVTSRKLDDVNKKLAKSTDLVERETLQATKASLASKQAMTVQSIAAQKLEMTTGKATKASGSFAHKSKQVAMQLSQVASQGSVTGNYLQALAIQLPDLALGFGALGVIVGALAGSLGVYLVDAMSASDNEAEKLLETIHNLTDGYKGLTAAQAEYISRQLAPKIEEETKKRDEAIKSAKNYTKWLAIAKKNLENMVVTQDQWGRDTSDEVMAKRKQKLKDNIKELSASLNDQVTIADTAQQQLKKYNKQVSDPTGSIEARNESVKNSILAMIDELSALELTNNELIKRRLMLEGATDAEIKSALAIQKSIDAEKAKQDQMRLAGQIGSVEGQLDPNAAVINAAVRRAEIIQAANDEDLENQEKYDRLKIKNAQKLSDDLIAIEKRTQQQNNQIITAGQEAALGYTGQLFGNLADIAKEGGEKQFQEYKNLASAQAVIAASLAAVKAYSEAPYPLNIALSTSIGALAAVQVAKIQGQEYQSSRASGGQATGRVLVGENGPEVLNLGSQTGYVSSNAETKGMMGGTNVTQVFQISAGVQGTVRSEILAAIPLIKKVAVQSVTQEARKGGPLSRAVGAR